jgi:hypothetical protein
MVTGRSGFQAAWAWAAVAVTQANVNKANVSDTHRAVAVRKD